MTANKLRRIIVLNFLEQGNDIVGSIQVGGIDFEITEMRIGWDFSAAHHIFHELDGEVDAFVLSGVRDKAVFGNREVLHHPTRDLIRFADRTPVYTGVDLITLFGNWTLRKFLREEPHFFKRKKVLFHTALYTPFAESFVEGDAVLQSADPLFLFGIPSLLKDRNQINRFFSMVTSLLASRVIAGKHVFSDWMREHTRKWLARWISECDVFVTYSALLGEIDKPEAFEGKVVFTDFLTAQQREKLERFRVAQIIEFAPDVSTLKIPEQMWSFGLTTAIMDQLRMSQQSPLELSEFALELIEGLRLEPRRWNGVTRVPRRCAFIIHPLSVKHLALTPGFSFLKTAPRKIVSLAESSMARVPVFRYGQLTHARSDLNGQEVICDIYALCATPRAMLRMDENFIYDQLVAAAEDAHRRGALMIGLGAYTKVIGDSGVTVARRSPIPVTTGNSYSAAATLWAARVMVQRMGFVKQENEHGQLMMKVMVLGATGSIGRVSAQLLSMVASEIVIVAPRPDKLLELRDELKALSPHTSVHVRTDPNEELEDTDLIVTATSNQRGQILDIMRVKPGAVICDCSRPLDIRPEEARRRPDVLLIESGEIDLPGPVRMNVDIGLPKPSVYACLAETVLLTMEGRYESFSLSRQLQLERVKEIYQLGLKHGARLSSIRNHDGEVTDEKIEHCRQLAQKNLTEWRSQPHSTKRRLRLL
jgi:predicted amino acid dehydrogenase